MAEYDLEALSLGELKKMQKDVAKAISTFEDRQKAEARAKVEALARDLGYSWPNSSAPRRKPLVRLSLRNTGTLRTQRSPGPAGAQTAVVRGGAGCWENGNRFGNQLI